MKHSINMIVAFGLLLMAATAVRAADLPEEWLKSLPKALEKAKAENKPVMAVFSAVWCGPCQEMVKDVYPKPEVRAELKKWIPVYIDVDEEKGIAQKYKVEAYPSFVLMSPSGAVEDLQRGGRPAASFIKMLQNHSAYIGKAADIEARLKANAKDAQAWKDKGENELLKDHNDEAQAAYKKVAELDPENKLGTADNLAFLQALPTENADLKAANEKLAAIETKYPDSDVLPRVRMLRVMLTINMDDLDGALALVNDGVKRFGDTDQGDRLKMVQGKLQEYMADRATKAAAEKK